jgi:aminopeptidase
MNDPRWKELAEILICYSTDTQPGDRVLISMIEQETLSLARAVYAQAVQVGAYPYVEFHSAYFERDLMRFGEMKQCEWVPEIQAAAIEWADVYLSLRGTRNPHEFSNTDSKKFVAHRQAMGKVSALRTEKTRWVIVRVPNEAFAQQASLSLDEAIELFFDATLCDWEVEAEQYAVLQKVFQAAETVHIVGDRTDLFFSTKGRKYLIDDGHINMPGGEIFTAPVEDSVEGHINFDFPGVFFGKKIEGIQLEFSQGRVVKAGADRNEALLHEIINMDEGAQRVGEFGIGTNDRIQHCCFDLFYDEKMGGTIHLALGRAYKDCGGVNQSALHWDIVKDMRTNGTIFIDSQKVFEAGTFYLD